MCGCSGWQLHDGHTSPVQRAHAALACMQRHRKRGTMRLPKVGVKKVKEALPDTQGRGAEERHIILGPQPNPQRSCKVCRISWLQQLLCSA